MQRQYKLYLGDILESIQKIENYVKNLTWEDFSKNPLVIDAVIRNLEIVGEATKKIPNNLKKKYADMEWRKIAGLRDILAHEYFGVNVKIIWDVVEHKLPEFKKLIKKIREEIK